MDVCNRFYGILQLLLNQFSIVLCYQTEFFMKCLESLADTLVLTNSENENLQVLRKQCDQIVQNLYAIDYKLLDTSISKLPVIKKTPLRKLIIDYEQQQKKGKALVDLNNSQVDIG